MQRLNAEEKEKPRPRKVRVHQMMSQVAPEKKFISYSLLCKQFGGVDPEDYEVVFDGQLGTDDLGKLYEVFNASELPASFTGHRLSISDVVDLYDQHILGNKNELHIDARQKFPLIPLLHIFFESTRAFYSPFFL